MKKLLYLFCIGICFFACKKNTQKQQLNGMYSGTFRTIVQGKLVMTDFDISLSGDQFKVTNGNKMGNGFYEIGSNYQIIFKDQNVWTTEFDWNLILNGNYTYKVSGDSLIVTKNLKPGGPLELPAYNYYQYRLKKIN